MVKKLTISFIIILICIFSISGVVAYLTATTRQGVINTFVAAGGGKIIDDNIPDGEEDDYNFNLKESLAVINETKTAYTLDTDNKVLANYYGDAVPGMTIAKDPTVSANITKNISAYLFIEVVDTTGGNLTYSLTDNWTELKGMTATNGGKVYVYNNSAIIGTDDYEVKNVQILAENAVSVNKNLVDVDAENDGLQLGKIEFYAYVSQSVGFAGPSDAFNTCFNL